MRVKHLFLSLIMLGQLFCIALAQDVFAPYNMNNNEILFTQEMYTINSIDPNILSNTAGSFFPGLRGANQLIIYSPSYGYRTNTNEFGTEAIVTGDTVTSISGADSYIPRDGIVISAHGKARIWMNENIIVGSKIYVDSANKVLTTYVTSDSFLYGAKEKIKEAQSIMEYYSTNSLTYDAKKPKKYIDQAQYYLNKAQKDTTNVQKYSALAIDSANSALASSIPFKNTELKGVWIRPTNNTEEGIIQTVEQIKKAGIDNIFLETYFHGKTIFPSQTMAHYGFLQQNELFQGIDPLKIWIDEAHKRNIKVHIWFETFYAGNKNPLDSSKSIIYVKPSWANTTKKAYDSGIPTPSLSEHNGYFIDPANQEVQDYLYCLIKEIIDTYKPDGINLDYIRYPQSIAAKYAGYELSNWGYTDFARNDFKTRYGVDPINILQTDPAWQLWAKYRQDKITDFVCKISNLTKQSGTTLTTVIFPDRQKALETKMQDWKVWSQRSYVSAYTPLFLTCDAKTANTMMQDVLRNKTEATKVYAGLFVTFMGGAQEDLLRQIHETRKLNIDGVVIFDFAHLEEKYVNTLMASVFNSTQDEIKESVLKKSVLKRKQKRLKFINNKVK